MIKSPIRSFLSALRPIKRCSSHLPLQICMLFMNLPVIFVIDLLSSCKRPQLSSLFLHSLFQYHIMHRGHLHLMLFFSSNISFREWDGFTAA